MTQPARIPVAIIGGGPAGATIAHRLAVAGVPSLVVERTAGSGNPVGETLAPTIQPLLARLGLAGALAASAPLPAWGNRSCWGGDALDERPVIAMPYGSGWHLDRPAFNAALLDAAEDAGARVLRRTALDGIAPLAGGGWRISLAGPRGPRIVDAGILVDAGGRSAPVARRLGVTRARAGSLVAAWTTLPRDPAIRDAATLVEATPRGWWYVAALPGDRFAAAWFSDPDLLAEDRPWTPEGWGALLAETRYTRDMLAGNMPSAATIGIAPAHPSRLDRVVGEGWIAVGDAAATHDPLSSMGIGSAMAVAAQGADALIAHLSGDALALPDYAARFAPREERELRDLAAVYRLEQRWPDAPFWRRRNG